MSITQNAQFDARNTFIGERFKICYYRFEMINNHRRRQMINIAQNYEDQAKVNESKNKIFAAVDEYVNCLRGSYKGEELPDYLQESVHSLKKQTYANLAPIYKLKNHGYEIASLLFSNQA